MDSLSVAAIPIAFAAAVAAGRPTDARAQGTCIDQEIADHLAIKRQRREHRDRLFIKQKRHEVTALTGYYASDLYSSTYVISAAYAFHMTDRVAIELSLSMTHADAELIRDLEDGRGHTIDDDYARVWFAETALVWSPVHGKLRLGGVVAHFDIHLDGGVGVVDAQTSRGLAALGGVGLRLFAGRAMALRLDLRNRVFQQELLDQTFWVNDVSTSLGWSVFLPLRN